MIYGHALIPNKFYRQYVNLYISYQSEFVLHPSVIHICGIVLSNIHTSPGNPILIFVGAPLLTHTQAIWFWGHGTG